MCATLLGQLEGQFDAQAEQVTASVVQALKTGTTDAVVAAAAVEA